ncbi:hypothetical protein VNO78_03443 [Psophocarpus tetragonolobus]|uniref:Protein kinase domain-containing protein n=1 Tax=Psophocarpus tetragonolobus TaxID=3891 RepID=A0AAN9T1H0_PSOTE
MLLIRLNYCRVLKFDLIGVMGCICSKVKSGVAQNHDAKPNTKKHKHMELTSDNDAMANLVSNANAASTTVSSDGIGDKNAMAQQQQQQPQQQPEPESKVCSRILSVTGGEKGAQVLAGWPSWLTAVAGEAISGWIPRRADSFEKLDKVGQGTYSSVYRARDLETNKIVALKKVRFANMDPESVRFMSREIIVLRRLDHLNVMKLEGMITSRVSGSLYLIFEYMDHDLAGLAAIPDIKFTDAQIKCYMQQLLRGLEHCHTRGVMHRDIKCSNLLVDSNGNLKIGDFGLATLFQPSQGQPLTSRVITLWYRPPELLLGATDYGVSVDLWSAGCILAELFVGKPIMPGRTEVEQLHKIFKLCGSPSEEYWKKSKLPHATVFKPLQPYKRVVSQTFKDIPSSAMSLLEVLLAVEPKDRGTASSALQHEFFTAMPLPCDPSTLPKYPPSKEFDAKLREEEARRRRAANKGHEHESVGRNFRESKAVPIPDAHAEFQASVGRQGQCNSKCNTEKYNPEEGGGDGFPREPAKSRAVNVLSHSGQSMHPSVYGSSLNMKLKEEDVLTCQDNDFRSRKSGLRKQKSYWHSRRAKLSRFSNSVAVRGDSLLDMSGESGVNSQWLEDQFGVRDSNLADGESNQLLDGHKSSQKDFHPIGKDRVKGYANKNGRMHSGPLFAPEDNLEEMLKEHERQIQEAVRKTRLGKDRTKKADSENDLTASLFPHLRNKK